MNLKNFEKEIEPKILDRGFSYYENDFVSDIEQIEKGEFCATVMGTEEYNVLIKLNKNLEIKEHSCDCPYDWGNVCKHEVAVMYYLKDGELYDQPVEEGLFYKMKTDLQKLGKKELLKIILELSKRNKTVREEIMWELGYEVE